MAPLVLISWGVFRGLEMEPKGFRVWRSPGFQGLEEPRVSGFGGAKGSGF
jgi:hypothetical protein